MITAPRQLRPHGRDSSATRTVATLIALMLVLCLSPVTFGQVNVTTQHNDNWRSGQNLAEPYLTPANVNKATFGKLFALPVDGAVYAQPLYLSGVSIPNNGTHNVLYVATQHDSVYAFDADSNSGVNNQPLWHTAFINPANGITTADYSALLACDDIIPEVGITGTPVIDVSTNTLYVVAKTQEDGVIVQRLHALDVTTGAEKLGGPVVIQGQVAGSGAGAAGGTVTFDPLKENQRAALLLQNGLVYIAWSAHCDVGPWRGWVMAYDSQSLGQVAMWISTPTGSGGGIWQSGSGLAGDSTYVYFSTGNGKFDADSGGTDFGDTVVKLSPPVGGTFSVADYFTPFDQDLMRRYDGDLGSGGVTLIPDQFPGIHQNLLVTGGKDGSFYLIDRDFMGHYNVVNNSDVQTLDGQTGHIYNSAAWWDNQLYFTGTGKPLQSFTYDLATGQFDTPSSSQSTNVFGGRAPTPSISVNVDSNAIVWGLDNGGFSRSKPTILYAYDARNLANLLYTSQTLLGPAVKFTVPTVANGKVYVGTATEVDVLGLLARMSSVAGSGQKGTVNSMLPVALQVKATDQYSGAPISGVTVTFNDGGKHGTFGSPVVVTNSSGLALTTYTLPTKTQVLTITASAPGYDVVTFTETGTTGPAAHVSVVSGNKQTGPPSTPLAQPFFVKVKDQYFNAVSGVPVTFTDGGVGGSFSANPVTTGVTGAASVSYTTPATTGTVKVKAAVTGLTAAIFTVTVQ